MYVSRLNFHTVPGKSTEVAKGLQELSRLVDEAGGARSRILRTHYASPGAPDIVFEQQAETMADLEAQIGDITSKPEFQKWSDGMSDLLRQSPMREIYIIT